MDTKDFDKEFYDTTLTVRERDLILCFEDDYHVEKAVTDMLDAFGFRITDKGYKYLVRILNKTIKCGETDLEMTRRYKKCAEDFSVSRKSVENGIVNAIKTAGKTGKLGKMNDLFNGEYVVCDGISNSLFIDTISFRFAIEYKYKRTIYFRV